MTDYYIGNTFPVLPPNDVYTKPQVDTSLDLKANVSDVYNKTQVDNSLALKADKTYVDGQLNTKANISTTYTKTEVDTNLNTKQNAITPISPLKWQTDTQTPNQLKLILDTSGNIYTKTEVDTLISNLIDGALTALNTLKELATALANDANYATNIQKNQLNLKNPLLTITNPSDGYRLITASNVMKAIKATLPLSISEDSNILTIGATITKTTVVLGNVDNTSDVNKPISTATSLALSDRKSTRLNSSHSSVSRMPSSA